MITQTDLKVLSRRRLKDAQALLSKKRYRCAIYISGYAVEVALKLNICKIFQFNSGFPENKKELDSYKSKLTSNVFQTIKSLKIKKIRNHNLKQLLYFSGKQNVINNNFSTEWKNIISSWNPEDRYKTFNGSKKNSQNVLRDVKLIVNNIL